MRFGLSHLNPPKWGDHTSDYAEASLTTMALDMARTTEPITSRRPAGPHTRMLKRVRAGRHMLTFYSGGLPYARCPSGLPRRRVIKPALSKELTERFFGDDGYSTEAIRRWLLDDHLDVCPHGSKSSITDIECEIVAPGKTLFGFVVDLHTIEFLTFAIGVADPVWTNSDFAWAGMGDTLMRKNDEGNFRHGHVIAVPIEFSKPANSYFLTRLGTARDVPVRVGRLDRLGHGQIRKQHRGHPLATSQTD